MAFTIAAQKSSPLPVGPRDLSVDSPTSSSDRDGVCVIDD
jgi:hypothetical protein